MMKLRLDECTLKFIEECVPMHDADTDKSIPEIADACGISRSKAYEVLDLAAARYKRTRESLLQRIVKSRNQGERNNFVRKIPQDLEKMSNDHQSTLGVMDSIISQLTNSITEHTIFTDLAQEEASLWVPIQQ